MLKVQFIILSLIVSTAHAETINTAVTTDSELHSKNLKYDLYSESLTATYFKGAVNQTRLRLLLPLGTDKIQTYFGVNTSNDFTSDSQLRYADTFLAPTAGVLVKPWTFLGLFAEYRRLYRTVNNELPDQENDPRYGAYTYFFKEIPLLPLPPHFELYAETVALTRFTTKPISTAWLKLGKEFQIQLHRWSFTPYLEGFYRESPDIMLGIDEKSLRLGGKLKWQWEQMSVQMYGYRRFESSSVPLGWEGFLVLAIDGGLRWK